MMKSKKIEPQNNDELNHQRSPINKKNGSALDNGTTHPMIYQDRFAHFQVFLISPEASQSLKSDLIRPPKTQVYVRCVFLKIFNIDTVNEQYFAEIFLQAKWREPLLDNETNIKTNDLLRYWNPRLNIENLFKEQKDIITFEVIYPRNDGVAYLVQKRRMKAIFHETLELMQFPFDCQDLSITVSTELSSEDVILSENEDDISKINSERPMDSQEWIMYNHVEVELKEIVNDCNIGPKSRRAITFTCRASRRFGYFIVNYFMISSMFFILTFCSFAVSENVFGRLQLSMYTLLTSVTFKVAVTNTLPRVPYLTYLDQAMLSNIILIMLICFWHASINALYLNPIQSTNITTTKIRSIEIILIPSFLTFYSIGILVFAMVIYFDAGSRRKEMQSKDLNFKNRLNERLSGNER